MITIGKQIIVSGTNKFDYDIKGLSTDTKPSQINGVDIAVNSMFLEMDTGDFYYLKQQGSESTTREDILSSTSVVCDEPYRNSYCGEVLYVFFDNLVVNVSFDGTKYTLDRTAYWQDEDTYSRYGEWDGDNPVFNSYPFAIQNCSGYYDYMYIFVPTEGTHTVEVYTEETVVVEPIWEKIGGGSSGMKNPKVVVTVVNPTENDIAVVGTYELKDGMLISHVRHMVKAGESEVIEYYAVGYADYGSLYDGTGETEVYYLDNGISGFDALGTSYYTVGSNFVNITEELDIIDPTKPTSLTATLTVD